MIYGIITNTGSVLIIGTDKQEVEDALKDKELSESSIEKQTLYRFEHDTERKNGKTRFGRFGRLTQYERTVQEEVDKMGELRIEIHAQRIKDFLHGL